MDQSLVSDHVEQARELWTRGELDRVKVGLRLKAKKLEVISNIFQDHPPLMTAGGIALKEVNDLKYLGSCVTLSEQDLKVIAWRALNHTAV